jgi:hypothetical protein
MPQRLLVVLLALAAACSDSGNGGNGGSTIDAGRDPDAAPGDIDAAPPIDAGGSGDDFLARFAAAYCERLEPACTAHPLGYDEARCHANAIGRFRQTFNYGRGRYDADAARACLGGLPDEPTGTGRDLPYACGLVFASNGPITPGSACQTTSECTSPEGQRARCFEWGTVEANGVREGRACVVVVLAGEDETCNEWGAPPPPVTHACREGLVCAAGEGGYRCRPRYGTPCVGTGEGVCHPEDMCDPETQTCAPAPGQDEPCGPDGICAPGFGCDFKRNTCQPRSPDGADCLDGDQCASGLCESGTCAAAYAGLCGAPSLTPRAQFTLDLAQARCEQTALTCCEQAAMEDEFPTCARDLAEASVPMAPLDGAFDADAAKRCLAAANQPVTYCPTPYDAGDPTEWNIPDEPDDCARAAPGTLPAGAACTTTAECALPESGMVRCDSGACRQYLVGADGDPCGEVANNTVVICRPSDDLFCSFDGVCAPTLPDGAECFHFAACTYPSLCDFSRSMCVAPTVGAPCDNDTQCAGLRCDPERTQCVALRAGGDPCNHDEDCASNGCLDRTCLGAAGAEVGYHCEGP